ncbi:cell wall metabolism sensor histidine kinase WalK [Pseudoflavonifractor sp. MSJ-37]|uniref:sensor histidine kinase n=1 Tax=Pseudoflavonifractor sp. MSJ-37 TaxID=2841531 RepID=UPI001C1247E3|nr:HAMP domain-containing sensor histidine kinase [Pseudoflavonifractor sp. MSJ-37]MBU5434446.1 HAMP domain-containing histidine kinase [Pseudoflavonifractor sp. MSJ-37]
MSHSPKGRHSRRWHAHTLTMWIGIMSIAFATESIVLYMLIDMAVRRLDREGIHVEHVRAFWILVPLILFVGVVSYLGNKRIHRFQTLLSDGLRSVADGDFSVRLDEDEGGPLAPAFADFNKMAEELQSVQTLRNDFINDFSHEFKTPITAVKGFTELLLEPGCSEEERQEYLQIILAESTRLADLTSSTLLLSKVESQHCISEKTDFPLDEQVKRCAILFSHAWEEKGISFTADLAPARYHGNEELMRQIWINLLSNAVKYTPQGGEISVSLTAVGDELAVSISDNGVGMSPEVQAHVFDKYYQGDPDHAGGLGLGLSIVHRIVALCGGRIELTSIEDQGSTFTVYLPRTA